MSTINLIAAAVLVTAVPVAILLENLLRAAGL